MLRRGKWTGMDADINCHERTQRARKPRGILTAEHAEYAEGERNCFTGDDADCANYANWEMTSLKAKKGILLPRITRIARINAGIFHPACGTRKDREAILTQRRRDAEAQWGRIFDRRAQRQRRTEVIFDANFTDFTDGENRILNSPEILRVRGSGDFPVRTGFLRG